MKRRNFITIMGLGLGSVALGSSVVSCSNRGLKKGLGWNNVDLEQQDIRFKVLAYAMLCPNPHNKQPWIIRLMGENSFNLYVDPKRLLPATDPYYRQIHIGQGTFLETLEIAASGFGYESKINYFPEGMYANNELLDKAVASIQLIPNTKIKVDPLFSQLLIRHSNKREYDNQNLSSQELKGVKNFHNNNNISQLFIQQSKRVKSKMEQFLTESMQIEVGDRARDLETIKMFRFNDAEVTKYRDGFGLAQSGTAGISKYIIENFYLSREEVENDPTYFGEQSVERAQKQAISTKCFAWITTSNNSRLDQVLVGREYCRLNLKTSAMGIVQHPMSQVLQEYKEMLPLQKSFKQAFNIKASETVQMLFRLGKAKAVKHGPRRVVHSIIR